MELKAGPATDRARLNFLKKHILNHIAQVLGPKPIPDHKRHRRSDTGSSESDFP